MSAQGFLSEFGQIVLERGTVEIRQKTSCCQIPRPVAHNRSRIILQMIRDTISTMEHRVVISRSVQ
jgi:hypothetical protein